MLIVRSQAFFFFSSSYLVDPGDIGVVVDLDNNNDIKFSTAEDITEVSWRTGQTVSNLINTQFNEIVEQNVCR